MEHHNNRTDLDVLERQAFWNEFLNTDEGRMVVGDLQENEVKHFHADGLLFELRRGEDDRIVVSFVRRE